MPKRYIDSDLPNKRWFRKLSPEYKTLWIYMTLWCNSAGIIDVDVEVWSIMVGSEKPFTEEGILEAFGDRIFAYKSDKWYLPGLTDFQQKRESIIECYKKGTNNNFYKSIINTLRSEGLLEGYVEGLARGSWTPLSTSISNSISISNKSILKDKEIPDQQKLELESEKKETRKLSLKRNSEQFELIWSAYPKKRDKKKAGDKYKIMMPDEELFNLIYADITQRDKSYQWRKSDHEFVPLLTTYLNKERWTDEMYPIDAPADESNSGARKPYQEDDYPK